VMKAFCKMIKQGLQEIADWTEKLNNKNNKIELLVVKIKEVGIKQRYHLKDIDSVAVSKVLVKSDEYTRQLFRWIFMLIGEPTGMLREED